MRFVWDRVIAPLGAYAEVRCAAVKRLGTAYCILRERKRHPSGCLWLLPWAVFYESFTHFLQANDVVIHTDHREIIIYGNDIRVGELTAVHRQCKSGLPVIIQ